MSDQQNEVAAQVTVIHEIAALVRAIRRAHPGEHYGGGAVMFTVRDIHEFAARLVEQGVTVQEEKAA